MTTLQNEQSHVSNQLSNVTGQIAAAQLANGSAANTMRILQKATVQPSSKERFVITAGIIGFAVGLLAGIVFVLARLQRGRHVRLRDAIARAAGAPVIASLESPACTTPSAWRGLLDGRPRATDEWALRHILHTVLREGRQPQIVRVISFAGDTPALTTGPRLALFAATSGTPTALIAKDPVIHDDRSLTPLRVCLAGAEPPRHALPFTVGLDDLGEQPPRLLVSVALFNGSSTAPVPSGTVTLLSISPNFVTPDELAQLALHAADCGSALDGVVVVNPDPSDTTSGLLADDTLRPLPAAGRAAADDSELVSLRARASTVNGSSDLLSSRDR